MDSYLMWQKVLILSCVFIFINILCMARLFARAASFKHWLHIDLYNSTKKLMSWPFILQMIIIEKVYLCAIFVPAHKFVL